VVGQKIVIIVSGNAEHGKDVLSNMLAEMLPQSRRDSYAAPLKMCVHLKTGIPLEILNGSAEAKNNPKLGRYGKTPRKLMQDEGELARQNIALSVWMDRAAERALSAPARITIISDGRHPEEEINQMRAQIEQAKGLAVSVGIRRPSMPVSRGHPSEDRIADAPDSLFGYVVVNRFGEEGWSDSDAFVDLQAKARQLADAIVLRAKGARRPEGWAVVCPGGRGRLCEALLRQDEAQILAAQPAAPCGSCGTAENHSVEPCTFDLITCN
jgi:hypothetical protein